ncbi:hypothetical protein T484DRAFT_1758219 [Baffinella frigidus]|nr:hypothetical protein T484DRAFT_1758219 [Cryptophyta sp. CCMP2293]
MGLPPNLGLGLRNLRAHVSLRRRFSFFKLRRQPMVRPFAPSVSSSSDTGPALSSRNGEISEQVLMAPFTLLTGVKVEAKAARPDRSPRSADAADTASSAPSATRVT